MIHGEKAVIHMKDNICPKFCRARTVPYAFRKKVENELDRLEKENVIQKVEHSDWATPIVVVPKTNGVRLCGEFKVTINPNVIPEHYPLPNAEDMFASLNGGNVFSKIDLTHAYQQLEMNEASKQYLTINTHKGLYRYQRMPYGGTSAPSIFQSVMDKLLNGIPGVQYYLDDILLCSKSVNEHIELLDKVLTRLVRAGVRVNKQKCLFSQSSGVYLGHHIDEYGIHPTVEKVRAIKEAPKPTSVKELRSYLGLVNYYGSEKVLRLATDASPVGVGAVLSHVIDGEDVSDCIRF